MSAATTFATAAHDVMDAPGLRPATVRAYHNCFKLASPLHARCVRRVTRRHVEECLRDVQAMGYAPKSVKCLLDFIKVVLRRNSSREADCIRFKVPQRPARTLDNGEHRALLAYLRMCSGQAAAGLVALLGTGLRVGELSGLRAGDWEPGARQLQVARGNGGPTKSGKCRTVDVPEWAAGAVDAWLNGGMVPERRLRRALALACEATGVPAGLRLHDLRHTRASRLLAAGAPVLWVSQQLGHSSPGFTLNTYGHLVDQESWANLA